MSDLFAVGQPIRLSTVVTDVTGAATDPTALTLTWYTTAGVAVTKSWPTPADITRASVGNFRYDIASLAAGHYRYVWTSTGTAAGIGPNPGPGVFDVLDPTDPSNDRLVSLEDVKTFLRISGTTDDDLIDRMITWASARLTTEMGAIISRSITETVEAAGCLVLTRTPVQSITTVTALTTSTPTVSASTLVITDALAGRVDNNNGVAPWGLYSVTYRAGYDSVPYGADGACLDLIRHWWNQSQAHGSATYGDVGFVPDFKGLPNSVINKLAALRKVPGIG
jgi:uncharacterized phiE125 gp8 family phage protein